MSVATLSLTAKTPETTTCQLADEYTNRLCSIHTIEYLGKHTHTQPSKKSQIYLYTICTRMNLKIIMQQETDYTTKNKDSIDIKFQKRKTNLY